MVMKFKIKNSGKKDNSHPSIKIALRKWLEQQLDIESVLDVYGGYGLMYKKVWNKYQYRASEKDSISWLNNNEIIENCFDIDPYASPYEALEIICNKTDKNEIGVVCTDGMLRRVCMMRTSIPDFLCDKCGWDKRDFSLMAGIYHQYPSFLRHVLSCICNDYSIDKLAIQYGIGTWKQATVYWACVLRRR